MVMTPLRANSMGPTDETTSTQGGQLTRISNEDCRSISGQYVLIGKVTPENHGFIGALDDILYAAIPPVTYQPNVEKYGSVSV